MGISVDFGLSSPIYLVVNNPTPTVLREVQGPVFLFKFQRFSLMSRLIDCASQQAPLERKARLDRSQTIRNQPTERFYQDVCSQNKVTRARYRPSRKVVH